MPANQRHLNNAPIREALVDMRVPQLRELPAEFGEELHRRLGDRFQAAQALQVLEATIASAGGVAPSVTSSHHPRGWLFRSHDAARAAQFRIDGFTFNRLRPYTSWEEVRDEALPLWDIYVELFHPAAISRLAVRYINEMKFPTPELDRYLDTPPRIPASLEYGISGYISRTLLDVRPPIAAQLTHALEPSLSAEGVTVLLDIDVYRGDEHDVGDGKLRARLDELRDIKNRIFFASITEAAAGLWA